MHELRGCCPKAFRLEANAIQSQNHLGPNGLWLRGRQDSRSHNKALPALGSPLHFDPFRSGTGVILLNIL